VYIVFDTKFCVLLFFMIFRASQKFVIHVAMHEHGVIDSDSLSRSVDLQLYFNKQFLH